MMHDPRWMHILIGVAVGSTGSVLGLMLGFSDNAASMMGLVGYVIGALGYFGILSLWENAQ